MLENAVSLRCAILYFVYQSNFILPFGKRYSRMTSKQSIQFFHTLLIIKYASNMQ